MRYLVPVGRVSTLSVPGLELWFNTSDHLPPHLHAEKAGDWEVRVYFLREPVEMFETKWTMRPGRPSRGELSELGRKVEESRAQLLVEWEQKVNVTAPGGQR